MNMKLLMEHHWEFLSLTGGCTKARLSLHLSKCHIVGNHMLWLISFLFQFQATQVLSGHTGPVTAISAINVPVDTEATAAMSYRTVIVTASVDSSVKFWTRSLDQGKK